MTAAKAPKVVRAQRFEVVDDEGRVRARIGPRTRRTTNRTHRSVAVELFDANGRAVAALTARDDGTVTLVIGPESESHVKLRRVGDRDLYGARAEIEAWARYDSRVSLEAVGGETATNWYRGPNLNYGDTTFNSRTALNRAVDHATTEIKRMRTAAAEARTTGDRARYRSYLRQARQLEGRISRATDAFEELVKKRKEAS